MSDSIMRIAKSENPSSGLGGLSAIDPFGLRAVGRMRRAQSMLLEGAYMAQARLDAIDTVASRALQGVALVTALEQQLSTTITFASSRLQAIADTHALCVSAELMNFARRV